MARQRCASEATADQRRGSAAHPKQPPTNGEAALRIRSHRRPMARQRCASETTADQWRGSAAHPKLTPPDIIGQGLRRGARRTVR
eukprot:396080-Prorocentrum_minimum.AAC.1